MNSETVALETAFYKACEEVGMREEDRRVVCSMLAPLRDKNDVTHEHYLHSLRVGLTARAIARFTHHEEKPLLFAGALHDAGKAQVPIEVLGNTGTWTSRDQCIISRHVLDGYRLLRGRFDFTAEIMIWHHRFQKNGYPKVLPPPLRGYSTSTKLLIVEYGRLLALADVHDALHRRNDRFKEGGGLSGEEVREKMFLYNSDRKELVAALYKYGVFTV